MTGAGPGPDARAGWAPDAFCPLCGAQAPRHGLRCVECGYHLAGVGGRPDPLSAPALWWTVGIFLAVFATTLGIVALTH